MNLQSEAFTPGTTLTAQASHEQTAGAPAEGGEGRGAEMIHLYLVSLRAS